MEVEEDARLRVCPVSQVLTSSRSLTRCRNLAPTLQYFAPAIHRTSKSVEGLTEGPNFPFLQELGELGVIVRRSHDKEVRPAWTTSFRPREGTSFFVSPSI